MPDAEMSAFEQRLAALEARYVELEELLSAPDAYQDLDRVQQLSREQAKLREVVEAARRWREAQAAGRGAAEQAPAEAADLVCGMTVTADASGHPLEHKGVTYYFCCAGCRRSFRENPAADLKESRC